ncbi:PCI domain-containing protein [Pleurostoma richardsiae]|uniref:PCI domain-containing protein n=1 Tax=Pleurostoma richardsiae TaxID=41990 RepID=A0AA38RPY2_9PEZI|nr:PCI domain-containing protein [Pleurostoma richardsiae]
MEQTKALNALEPFLALSKTATSPRAAADLVTRATSAPGTFVFAELLDTPNIRALASSPEHAPHLALLRVFSYGTYASYLSTPGLPPLSDAQALKLRQLSLLTLARDPAASLSYASLMRALALDTPRALEDAVISAVYAGLLSAQLDPARGAVQVSGVAALRDLAPGELPALVSTLEAWSGRCEATLADLESQIAGVRAEAARRAAEKRDWDAAVKTMVEEEKVAEIGGGGGVGGGGAVGGKKAGAGGKGGRYGKRTMEKAVEEVDDEAMDLDDVDDEAEGKKRASRRKL